ncbi:hypothetical protein [Piscinibacter sakaiensis]|uniref:hypothetical protein n=1 Tax=Piscinibacter sakaiensis TaxID=1547922 RepID=UPI003AAEAF98
MKRFFHSVTLAAAVFSGAAASAPAIDPFGGLGYRERLLIHFDHLPVPRLEAQVLACDRSSRIRMMGFEEGALCAMAWDALLKRHFGGDVNALLAWWRTESLRTGGD